MPLKTSIGVLAISLLLSACGKQAPEHEPASPTAQTQAASAPAAAASVRLATDAWVGRWIGPEGTFLDIAGGSGTYRVTVQNLDGPRTFDATCQRRRDPLNARRR